MMGQTISKDGKVAPFRGKMEAAGLSEAAIRAFAADYAALERGESGLIAESTIEPVRGLPQSFRLSSASSSDLLRESVVIKLNGGLGTSMGLARAKSLLPVRDADTFLDFIARQILRLRTQTDGGSPRFLLMNSFSTLEDTRAHLSLRFPDLGNPADLDFLQSRVPKIAADSLAPAEWPSQPDLEWCPPGHGDIYACLAGSGWLDRLLEEGILYAFVSNADNLGATLDSALLEFFASSDKSFLMEVTRRTLADRKGGHLAVRKHGGRLVLRESAQCPKSDEGAFQDIERHQFFNTNNLWIRLDRLREELDRHDGLLPLPVIINRKTVDPRDPDSPPVIQLETAMGAAIESFADAGAIEVPRQRFAPVKTTSDLLAVRSDAYVVTDDFRLELHPERHGQPPHLHLDQTRCKLIEGLDAAFPMGPPSLLRCDSLLMHGPIQCDSPVIFRGNTIIHNHSEQVMRLKAGTYEGELTIG